RHMMQTGLCGIGRFAGRQLEQRQIVVLLAEAEEHRSPLRVLVGHLEAQGPGVKVLRLAGVADFQHEMTELLCLNHVSLPPPEASARAWLRRSSRTTRRPASPRWRGAPSRAPSPRRRS